MYEAKKYDTLLGAPGFSDALLKNHFTLYEGYVKNTNTLIESLRSAKYAPGTPEWNELTRRFGWEWNGMRLHELYFPQFEGGAAPAPTSGAFFDAIAKDYHEVGHMVEMLKHVNRESGGTPLIHDMWICAILVLVPCRQHKPTWQSLQCRCQVSFILL